MKHLQEIVEADYTEINGIIWGHNKRLVAPLVVSNKNAEAKKIVIFIIGTISPQTYLTEQVFSAFGLESVARGPRNMIIHGKEMPVEQSYGSFGEVNILGSDFLAKATKSPSLFPINLKTETKPNVFVEEVRQKSYKKHGKP